MTLMFHIVNIKSKIDNDLKLKSIKIIFIYKKIKIKK